MPLAIATYFWLKAFHVLASVLWVGGGAAITLMAWRAQFAKDTQQLLTVAKQAEWLGSRFFPPLSIVVLAFGIGMIENAGLGWGSFWIDFGIAIWALSFAVGAGFLGPESGRLAKLMAERGPTDPAVLARVNRIVWVARIDVVLLLLVVFDMTAKPFL